MNADVANSGDMQRYSNRLAKRLARPLYVWTNLRSQYILPLEGYAFVDGKTPALITKWHKNGDLLTYLSRNPNLSTTERCRLVINSLATSFPLQALTPSLRFPTLHMA